MRLGICCIAKNEELYINDWLEYHFNLGFDEVYIYDNNDEKYIKDYIKKDFLSKVTIIDCHNKNQYQLSAYNDFFQKYSSKFDWVSVIDCDEFITLQKSNNLKNTLEKFNNTDIIIMTWEVFGDDDKITDDTSIPVYERFFKGYIGPVYKCNNIMIKCLMNCSRNQKYVWHSCHHPNQMSYKVVNSKGENYKLSPSIDKFYDDIYIRHYMTKSLSEFINQKLSRQDARFDKICQDWYYFKINKKTQEKLDFLNNYKRKDMKKLSLRLYCSKNYGSILTNWALYKLLQKLGYNPYVDTKNSLIEVTQPWWCGESWNILTDDIRDIDAYIVGSDCSFGFIYKGGFDRRFLLQDVSVPKISISASLLKRNYSDEQLKEIKEGLSDYRFISIRDKFFLDRMRNYFEVENPEVIIDPLFLMGSEFVNSIASQSKRTDKNYDFCYFLDCKADRLKVIDNILSKKEHCFFVPTAKANRDLILKWLNNRDVELHKENLKLKDFLYMIKNANKIYTDSFHGTVLAILFGKEVEFIPNRTLERFDSLKEMLNLKENKINENQYKEIYNILENVRNENIKKIKKVLDALCYESILKRDCTGCGTCSHICPTNAIVMEDDICGFKYPKIDINKCLNCGKCKKSCHILNVNSFSKKSQSIKAVKTKDEINQKSSSAGLFTLLAEYVLKKDGVVFGVEWENNYSAKHSYIEKIEDLDKFRLSKYVQSDTKNTFQEAKDFLDNDRYVLYTGTPCQISALNNFLGKRYDKLITSDICCNSVPSSKILNQYLSEIGEENSKVIFRDSKQQKVYFKVIDKDNEKIIENSLFMKGFLQHHFVRDCCYGCRFATSFRQGDFTLGDFWKKSILKDLSGKISFLSINSQKANTIWQEIIQKEKNILNIQEILNNNLIFAGFNTSSAKILDKEKKNKFIEKYKKTNTITGSF